MKSVQNLRASAATFPRLSRRHLLATLAAAMAVPRATLAEEVIPLEWSDLQPEDASNIPNELRGFIDHDSAPLVSQQPESTEVRTEWNGKIVRINGFVVPIEYSGDGIVAFILVPYVGACVHVPPPPANQLVFVTTNTPYENDEFWSPVSVTGMFGVSAISTRLADIGYALSADKIEPFDS